MFATHYHELTELEDTHERVENQHIAVREFNDEIIFLHKLMPGGTNRSYGVQVGRLAGLPKPVIERAKAILKDLEALRDGGSSSDAKSAPGKVMQPTSQLSLFGGSPNRPSAVEDALREIHPDTLSPLEAIQALYTLKEVLRESEEN